MKQRKTLCSTNLIHLVGLFLISVIVWRKVSNSASDEHLSTTDGIGAVGGTLKETKFVHRSQKKDAQEELRRDQYDRIKGKCFTGETILHTNNRPGTHDACYAACLGYNIDFFSNFDFTDKEFINLLDDEVKADSDVHEYDWSMVDEYTYDYLSQRIAENVADRLVDKATETADICVGWTSQPYDGGDEYSVGTKTCNLKSYAGKETLKKNRHCDSGRLWKGATTAENSDFIREIQILAAERVDKFYMDLVNAEEEIEVEESEYEGSLELNSGFVTKGKSSEKASSDSAGEEDEEGLNSTYQTQTLPFVSEMTPLSCNSSLGLQNGREVRSYVICLQSSGCTLLAFLMGQSEEAVSVLDIGVRQKLPSREYFERAHEDYPFTKYVTIKHSLRGQRHPVSGLIRHAKESFAPDYTFLFLRHPLDTFLHLITHIGKGTPNEPEDKMFSNCGLSNFNEFGYGLRCGTPLSKLENLNTAFKNQRELGITNVFTYESLCSSIGRVSLQSTLNEMGVCVEDLETPKHTIIDVVKRTSRFLPSSKKDLFWGVGHLESSFHYKKTGEPKKNPFSKCETDSFSGLSERERKKLLNKAGSPYKTMSLSDIESRVRSVAPDLFKFYEELQISNSVEAR